MTTDIESNPRQECSVFADLAALLCRGGLVVESAETPDSIAIQSTIQLDGDITVFVARPALGQPVLFSHLAETEKRIRRLALLVKRTVRAAYVLIGLTVPIAWFYAMSDSLSFVDPLISVAIGIGLSVVSGAVIEYLLRTPFVQKLLLSTIVSGLTRLTQS